METRSGVIQSIELENFLIHSKLKVDFEKSITFIVGGNGSGKSAIVDALILGLGGTASQTRRCDNIKSFIKSGTKYASIEIKIKDVGTIFRKISENGSSTYKVNSEQAKYDVVKSILLAKNIQIDNPISVLTQNTAKEFHSFTSEVKYRFFLRATNLAQSEEKYNKALEECSIAEHTLRIKNKEFENYRVKLAELEAKKKDLELKKQCQAEINQLKAELKFSKFLKLKGELEKKDKWMRMKNEIWSRKDDIVKCLKVDYSNSDELKTNRESKMKERTILEKNKNKLDDQLSTFNRELQNYQTSEREISTTIATEEEIIKGLNEKLENIRSGSAARRREEVERLVKEASEKLQKKSKLVKEAEEKAKRADEEYTSAQQRLQEAKARKKYLDSEKSELEKEQLRLQNTSDPVAKYGECATRLRERVRSAAALFRQPPRGPVGVYLSVKNEIWGGAFEHILDNAIKSYCVDNSEDERKLCDIIDEVYADSEETAPDVICCPFLEYKLLVRAPQGLGSVCALDALDVDDVVVHNFLVDQLNLDTILLVETDEQAMQFCHSEENVPSNCKKVVTRECSEYYPAPEYRCYGGKEREVRYLHACVRAAQRALSEKLAKNSADAAAAARTLSEVGAEHSAADTLVNTEHAQLKAARAEESELRKSKESYESELSQMKGTHLNEANLLSSIEISQKFLNEQKSKKSETEKKLKNCTDNIEDTKQKLNDLTEKLKSVKNKITDISEELDKIESDHKNKQSEIDQIKKKHKKTKEILNQMEKYLESERPVKEDLIKKFKSDAERMNHGPILGKIRSENELQTLLDDKENNLSLVGAVDCDPELDKKLYKARKDCQTVKTNLEDLENLIKELRSLVESHLRAYLVRLNCVSLHVQKRFQEILRTRGMQWNLQIDKVLKRLWFDPENRQASGGERTFALVAFLVALQDCVNMPFFCMDEFHVFLDGVNNESAVEWLLEAARMRPDCKYVFVTPTPPFGLRSSSDLDILTMSSLKERST